MSLSLSAFLQKLQRPAVTGGFVPQLEGLRFAALTAVFFFHLNFFVLGSLAAPQQAAAQSCWEGRLFQSGAFGVQLFFCVSGFVLALPFARWRLCSGKPVELRRYFGRRLWRLEPPLFINLLLLAPLALWVKKLALGEVSWRVFLSMAYCHHLVMGELNPVNRVTWSLETEAQFYLLMPLAAGLFTLRSPPLRRCLLLGIAAACIPFKMHLNKAFLPAQFEFFASGILLAEMYATRRSPSHTASHRWDLAGLAAWAALVATLTRLDKTWTLTHYLQWIFLSVAVASTLRGTLSRRLWSLPPLTFVGGTCYSFYLYHDRILALGVEVMNRRFPVADYLARLGLYGVVLLPVTLILVTFVYGLFERPFMGGRPGGKARAAASDGDDQSSAISAQRSA